MNEKEKSPFDQQLDVAFAEFDASQKITIRTLDESIHSRWIKRKEKAILIMVKQLVIMVNALTKDSIMAMQFDRQIAEAIQVQNKFLYELAKKCEVEFPVLKAEINKLQTTIENPAIAHMFAYLNERKTVLEKGAKSGEDAGDKYVA